VRKKSLNTKRKDIDLDGLTSDVSKHDHHTKERPETKGKFDSKG